jgi:hypothetical protein
MANRNQKRRLNGITAHRMRIIMRLLEMSTGSILPSIRHARYIKSISQSFNGEAAGEDGFLRSKE